MEAWRKEYMAEILDQWARPKVPEPWPDMRERLERGADLDLAIKEYHDQDNAITQIMEAVE